MPVENAILLGKAEKPVSILLRYANRHGLIAGATGTGKTVTLKLLAEGFSSRGVPVFLADVKGDLAGFCHPGERSPKLAERLKRLKLADFSGSAFPVVFWDVFGQQGHPIRTTVSEMGPLLLARLMELPEAQEGILNIVFKIADDQGLLLLDFKDLRALLQFASENAAEIGKQYGNVTRASIGAIQRRLLVLEQQGADKFFGEPALAIDDLLRLDADGHGQIHVLAADKLFRSPRAYSTLLLWLLAELFETMPEVGDEEAPRLVFFFDEAHLLFENASKALVEQVEQVVRLIRSKGIGIYFVTQSPLDIPDDVLAQLGNRVQHALRASTPREQKAVRAIAETMAANPKLDTADAITKLAVGEALVSTLDDAGRPGMVARTLIAPPASRFGPITLEERTAVLAASPLKGRYDQTVDRESAYERLNGRAAQAAVQPAPSSGSRIPSSPTTSSPWGGVFGGGRREGLAEAMAKSVARSVGSAIGREIARGVFRAMFRSR